jgi:hypothetical protein
MIALDRGESLSWVRGCGRVADYPGMIGKGYADLRDLPLGGAWIGIIRKLDCHSFGSRSQSLPAV